MFDITWMKLMVIVGVALIVFGPRDLPTALRTFARSLRVIRRIAREFQTEADQLIRASELDALRRDVEDAIKSNQSEPPMTISHAPNNTHAPPSTPPPELTPNGGPPPKRESCAGYGPAGPAGA